MGRESQLVPAVVPWTCGCCGLPQPSLLGGDLPPLGGTACPRCAFVVCASCRSHHGANPCAPCSPRAYRR